MTVANISTREVAEARRDRIKSGLPSVKAWREDVLAAWRERDWVALGYATWNEMADAEGYPSFLAVSREERPELVANLRQEGMSTRAIAAATGTSRETVRRDLEAGDTHVSPEVRGVDGKTYAPTQPVRVNVPTIVEPPREVTVNVVTEEPEPEVVEVLTAEEWAKREGYELPNVEPAVADVIDLTARPHVANNSGNNEWYTPSEYIEAARRVFDDSECPEDRDDCWDCCDCPPITTDPASSDAAQSRISARYYFTAEDDGLAQQWHGNVWMNPPYSGDLVGRFIDKLLVELNAGRVRRAIVLVNNATETQWAHRLLSAASAVCFPKGRIRYLTPGGQPANTPLQGQMFVYLDNRYPGDPSHFGVPFDDYGTCRNRWDEFESVFGEYGPVVVNP